MTGIRSPLMLTEEQKKQRDQQRIDAFISEYNDLTRKHKLRLAPVIRYGAMNIHADFTVTTTPDEPKAGKESQKDN